VSGEDEDQDRDGGSLFGQILRREEVRIGEKYVGIAKNGRMLLRMRRSTWDLRLTKTKNNISVRLHGINRSSQLPL